jgi:uncharacterized phage protein gp47/JayE
MINFNEYTKENIENSMLNEVSDDLDKREGSLIQTAIGPVAWWLEGMYLTLNQIQQNSSPFYAVGDALDDVVALRGVTRKQATPAVRKGIFDAEIPTGSQFKTVNGADSVIFISGDLISEVSGVYTYKMTCAVAGTIGNNYSGALIPVTAIPNLTSAVLGDAITEGTEEESDESLRQRFFNSFGSQPYGGNIAEYRKSILEIPGVSAVQIYPTWQGGGTVLCSILNGNYLPASQTLIDTVQNAICPPNVGESTPSPNGYGVAPIGASVTITTGTELSINIEATIQFDANIVNGLELYQEAIEAQIRAYIESVRKTWGTALATHEINYPVTIYTSRIVYAILNVPEVVNVTDLTVNGQSFTDLVLTETSALQQVPVVGTITLHEA